MDGYQYEQQCAQYLKQRGFRKVAITKGSGDQGVDIIAYRQGKKYGIQCKYYTGTVGNKAVQEAYAGAAYYECDVAVVMTNSEFTKAAEELGEKIGVALWPNKDRSERGIMAFLFRVLGVVGMVGAFGLLGAEALNQSVGAVVLTIAGSLFLGAFLLLFANWNRLLLKIAGVLLLCFIVGNNVWIWHMGTTPFYLKGSNILLVITLGLIVCRLIILHYYQCGKIVEHDNMETKEVVEENQEKEENLKEVGAEQGLDQPRVQQLIEITGESLQKQSK